MKAFVPQYDLVAPASLGEALRLMGAQPAGWRPIAGGTDLMVLFETGNLPYKQLLSLWKIPELRGITSSETHVTLGALTTYSEIRRNELMQREFPALVKAASWTGATATQNRGTLGGNIANASPAADSPPALLIYDAEIELVSTRGSRWVPYHSFHTGYKTTVMAWDEIIGHISIPRATADCAQYLRKVGTRRAQAISKIALGGLIKIHSGVIQRVRIALGSVSPAPMRARLTEAILTGRPLDRDVIEEARNTIAAEIAPIDDIRSTARYRQRVTVNLLQEFLESLIA